jgi:hypothetical protein
MGARRVSRTARPWLVAGAILVTVASSAACSRPRQDGGRSTLTVDASIPGWTLPKECQSCLVTECDAVVSGARPLEACAKEPSCFAAFASFVRCFAQKPLKECRAEVEAVKRGGGPGEDLLACFMHICFAEGCELTRSANP